MTPTSATSPDELTPSALLDSALFNGALSPYQTQLNELLNRAIGELELLVYNPNNSDLVLALNLVPVLDHAQRSLSGTDLEQLLGALQGAHHALLVNQESYLQGPLFSAVQDLLVEQIAPLQAQFVRPNEQVNVSDATNAASTDADSAAGTSNATNASNSSESANPDPTFATPAALGVATASSQILTTADLEAKAVKLRGNLQQLKSLAQISPKDFQVIDDVLTALESQIAVMGSMSAFDASSPLVIGNMSLQFEETIGKLTQELSPSLLSQLIAIANPISPGDFVNSNSAPENLDSPNKTKNASAANGPASENVNEFESNNPNDPKEILESHQIPLSVRAQFIAAQGGQYHYKDRDHAIAFIDAGGKLKTGNADPQVASAMVAIAKAKGWGSLKIKGSSEFKSAVWLAAQLAGMPTQGYQPTELDRALLAKAIADLQTNSIAQGENRQQSADKNAPTATKSGLPTVIDAKQARAMAASEQGFAGVVIDCGQAPYQFSTAKGEPMSYFVKMRDATGTEQLFWGKELEPAVQMAGGPTLHGQSIVLYQRGKKAVQTLKPVRDAKGEVVRQEAISAMRNDWEIVLSGPAPEIEKRDLSPGLPQAPIDQSPDQRFTQMARTFTQYAQSSLEDAQQAIAQYPDLVHVFASQKTLLKQAAQTFSDPSELALAQESINKVLAQRVVQGRIATPQVLQSSYAITLEAVYERPVKSPGNAAEATEQVLRFTDAANCIHEITGVDISLLSPAQLTPGAPLTLSEIPSAANPDQLCWQASMRDPAIALHGVAAAEWARTLGANDAQAKRLANNAMGILESFSQSGGTLTPPILRSGPGVLNTNPPADPNEPSAPPLDLRKIRNIAPARA